MATRGQVRELPVRQAVGGRAQRHGAGIRSEVLTETQTHWFKVSSCRSSWTPVMVSDGSAIVGSPSAHGVKVVSTSKFINHNRFMLTERVYTQSAHAHESPEASEHDLYVRFKTLQRQLEFVEIQVSQRLLYWTFQCDHYEICRQFTLF
jgi:hypothetical protein